MCIDPGITVAFRRAAPSEISSALAGWRYLPGFEDFGSVLDASQQGPRDDSLSLPRSVRQRGLDPGVRNDFEYRNNVVEGCNYGWTSQGGVSALVDAQDRGAMPATSTPLSAPQEPFHYNVIGSYFGNNRPLTGSGTGVRLEYKDIDSSFLELIGASSSEQSVAIERDQSKRNYLHPVAGSEAAKVGAGLLTQPIV